MEFSNNGELSLALQSLKVFKFSTTREYNIRKVELKPFYKLFKKKPELENLFRKLAE